MQATGCHYASIIDRDMPPCRSDAIRIGATALQIHARRQVFVRVQDKLRANGHQALLAAAIEH
jgi:hypothetical protein